MESKLKQLQDRMQQQRIEDEAVVRVGGARWKGARTDKGSVLNYERDLREKYKLLAERQGGGDPAAWIPQERRTQRPVESLSGKNETKDFRLKGI